MYIPDTSHMTCISLSGTPVSPISFRISVTARGTYDCVSHSRIVRWFVTCRSTNRNAVATLLYTLLSTTFVWCNWPRLQNLDHTSFWNTFRFDGGVDARQRCSLYPAVRVAAVQWRDFIPPPTLVCSNHVTQDAFFSLLCHHCTTMWFRRPCLVHYMPADSWSHHE